MIAGQGELLSRLRAVVEAKDAENAVLRQELDAERELRRRLELRLAELERRLSMDSVPVSAGWVDKAAARVAARLRTAGFDEAMIAALTAEEVLAADETPVNVLDKTAPQPAAPGEEDPEEKEKAAAGAPHVSPSAARKPRNATRPSPATGTH